MEHIKSNNEETYLMSFTELDYLCKELRHIYNSKCINDINDYVLNVFGKMLNVWESIYLIFKDTDDLTSLFSLTRTIVDNFATIYLIHLKPDSTEERLFRYWLYILNGIDAKIQSLKKIINSDDKTITKELRNKNRQLLNYYIDIKKDIDKQLKEFSLYNQADSSIIESNNWKYKTICKPKKGKNQYSWADLYDISLPYLSLPTVTSNFFSQFAHGLPISNLDFDEDITTIKNIILSFNISYMNSTKKAIEKLYSDTIKEKEIDFMYSDALKSITKY